MIVYMYIICMSFQKILMRPVTRQQAIRHLCRHSTARWSAWNAWNIGEHRWHPGDPRGCFTNKNWGKPRGNPPKTWGKPMENQAKMVD